MSQIYKPVNGGSGAVLSITTDSGTVSGENLQLFAITDHADAGSSVSFSASTATEMDLNLTDIIKNTILGLSSGNKTLTGENNTAVGFQTLHALTSGDNNTVMGVNAGLSITSGTTNTLIGFEAGQSISSGGNNTVVGYDSFISATTALNNTIIGAQSGLNYTSSESNNINIGVAVPGVTGESNVTRIGSDTQATCFITGITGNTVSNQQFVTINSATSQLGITTNAGSGNLSLLSSQTASSSASIIFTDVTGFDNYYLVAYGVVCSTNCNILIQYSNNNGSTFVTSGYSDEASFIIGGAVNGVNNVNAGSTWALSLVSGSSLPFSGYVTFFNFNNAAAFKSDIFSSTYFNNEPNDVLSFNGTGNLASTTVVNALQVLPSAGTFTSGKFKLYGIVN